MSLTGSARSEVTRRQLVVAAAGVLEAGCSASPKASTPTIRFTRIPKADTSGSDQNDIIEGEVSGASQGQQIVLYAKNGSWWLQPLIEAPFTRILSNDKWRSGTHLGSDYAALLVNPGYRPDQNIKTLPPAGGLVAAVSVTKGASVSPSHTLQFSGYEWRVRGAFSNRGGWNNPYSTDNAWTDNSGALHLRIKKKGDRYECAEVALTRSLGYGSYSFLVRDLSKLARDITLEMFTWDYSGTDQNSREMDIVFRRRSSAPIQSARFIVQPYGYAEFVPVPYRQLIRVERKMKWDELAPLTDAGVTPYRGIKKLRAAGVLGPGRVIAVFGASGLGSYAVQYAKLLSYGATIVVFARNDEKLAIAKEHGADCTINTRGKSLDDIRTELFKQTGKRKLDAVIDCVGAPETIQTGFGLLATAGAFVTVGLVGTKIEIPLQPFVAGEFTYHGSYWSNYTDLQEVLALAQQGKIRHSIKRVRFEDINENLEMLRAGIRRRRGHH